MWHGLPLHPEQASSIAPGVDSLYYFLTAVTLFFSALIFLLIFYFAVKYRRARHERSEPVTRNIPLEILWVAIPMMLVAIMFFWGSSLFIRNSIPPAGATEVFVVGKQWMWHLQHPEGVREINELHVPLGRPIKLTMTSEDVIHSFGVPAFRLKQDVLPGRYTSLWFEPRKTGQFYLFCDQYCGTNHSLMRGSIIVMTPKDYGAWLSGGVRAESMAQAGARLYQQYGCITCHGTGKAPPLIGLFGKPVRLENGQTVIADEGYIRESILFPTAKIVAGYSPIMPTFAGQLTEEQLLQIIAYIKSLSMRRSSTGEGVK